MVNRPRRAMVTPLKPSSDRHQRSDRTHRAAGLSAPRRGVEGRGTIASRWYNQCANSLQANAS